MGGLVSDHDPKPLYYQFAAEHASQLSWDYLQRPGSLAGAHRTSRPLPVCSTPEAPPE